ncbi:neurotransmitter-gated ion-channel ligand binding domain-containing protein [Zopfochytrium polystomum]|nr:neurotransmitter-gated ion-channel ligand binding domain-containing protein [Zopfochytrium polystomum]
MLLSNRPISAILLAIGAAAGGAVAQVIAPAPSSLSTSTASATTSTATAAAPTASSSALSLNGVVNQLLTGYDKTVRPSAGTGDPTLVAAQFQINRLFNVNPISSDFKMDLYLRLLWNDSRLATTFTTNEQIRLDPTNIWVPDVQFYNQHKPTGPTDESCQLKVPASGTVQWNRHFVVDLYSTFYLYSFPYDTQNISIRVVSLSYPSSELQMGYWPASQGGAARPSLDSSFSSDIWTLAGQDPHLKKYYNSKDPNSTVYAGIEYTLTIDRDPTIYIIKYVLPLFFIAFSSTLSYWVDPGVPPARVGFVLTLLVAAFSLNYVVSAELPKVNYLSTLDTYVVVAVVFVLVSIVEFAVVHYTKVAGAAALSAAVEWAFRAMGPFALVAAWILVRYGTGNDNKNAAGKWIGTVILVLSVVGGAAFGFVQYRKLAAAAAAKAK